MPHSSHQPPLRIGIKDMLRNVQGSHIITLTFHDSYSLHRAKERARTWYCRVMRRLFGRKWAALPATDAIEVMLLPEGIMGNIHFHGQMRLPLKRLGHFERTAQKIWSALVPTGRIFIEPVRPAEIESYFNYITKEDHSWSEFIHLPGMRDLH